MLSERFEPFLEEVNFGKNIQSTPTLRHHPNPKLCNSEYAVLHAALSSSLKNVKTIYSKLIEHVIKILRYDIELLRNTSNTKY